MREVSLETSKSQSIEAVRKFAVGMWVIGSPSAGELKIRDDTVTTRDGLDKGRWRECFSPCQMQGDTPIDVDGWEN